MERKQFTFYRSFWDALRQMNKGDRLALFEAIATYGLDGKLQKPLTDRQNSIFTLIRPNLDASYKKAVGAMQGKIAGNRKDTGKDKRNEKENEKEKENKNEIETETENDCSKGVGDAEKLFDSFWSVYPKKVGKAEARTVFAQVDVPVEILIRAVQQQRSSLQWSKEGGRFIPNPASWLRRKGWEDELPDGRKVPMGATGILGKEELENIRRVLAEG